MLEEKELTVYDDLEELDDYEEKIEKICDNNNAHLTEFEKHLKDNGLSKKTIDNHVSNVRFYLNNYLARYEAEDVTCGCISGNVANFLGNWFIRKTTWASCSHIKSNAASFKKFYAFMLEKGVVRQEDYDELTETIKEEMSDWLEEMRLVEEAELNL